MAVPAARPAAPMVRAAVARLARRPVRTRTRTRTRAALGLALLGAALGPALVGCASAPLPPPPDDPAFVRVGDPEARRLLAQGLPEAAADVYSARAARAGSPAERQDYLLIAAEILYDRGLAEPGRARLDAVPEALADDSLRQRRQILVAKSWLIADDGAAALAALPDPAAVASPLQRARAFETRAQAYRLLDEPGEELAARVALQELLSDPDVRVRGREQIWQLLVDQPVTTLERMAAVGPASGATSGDGGNETYRGWVELALAEAEAGGDPERRAEALAQWRTLFPDHPAAVEGFVDTLSEPTRFAGFTTDPADIRVVAVLLPLTDPATAAVAGAIRDGMIAAREAARAAPAAEAGPGPLPELRFVDVGLNPAYARGAYERAVRDGADAVVGPLRKEAVAAIVTQRRIPVPTLTLNTVEYAGARAGSELENAIQFGLAPEDEARSAASRAMALSLDEAVVLQSDDSRAEREARAFSDAMHARGGDVVHVAVLPQGEYDYSEQIREALEIDESDARFRDLSRAIGQRLFFEPAVRDDANVVFLALTSEQAKSVRPQLDFFRAAGIPRLATSRVAGAEDDPRGNRDLNTIWYADAPWELDPALGDDPLVRSILEAFPDADGAYGRLYALGSDAWLLVTRLGELAGGAALPGFTGTLSLGTDGRIRRELDWAQYRDGVAVPVERVESPEPATRIGAAPN